MISEIEISKLDTNKAESSRAERTRTEVLSRWWLAHAVYEVPAL